MTPVHQGVAPGGGFHVGGVVGALGRVAADVAVHLVQVGLVGGAEVGLGLAQDFDDALARMVADAAAVAAVLAHRLRLFGFKPFFQLGGAHVYVVFEGGVAVAGIGSFGTGHSKTLER